MTGWQFALPIASGSRMVEAAAAVTALSMGCPACVAPREDIEIAVCHDRVRVQVPGAAMMLTDLIHQAGLPSGTCAVPFSNFAYL